MSMSYSFATLYIFINSGWNIFTLGGVEFSDSFDFYHKIYRFVCIILANQDLNFECSCIHA